MGRNLYSKISVSHYEYIPFASDPTGPYATYECFRCDAVADMYVFPFYVLFTFLHFYILTFLHLQTQSAMDAALLVSE
jgi:hypothetical protein